MIDVFYFNQNIDLKENVSCIGSFDGVHKGHQQLIKRTIDLADKNNVEPYVITFDPDPAVVIGQAHYELTDLNRRIELFEHFGLKGVIVIPFNTELMRLSSEEFKKQILDKLNLNTLVCGFDFTYGYKGSGNAETLKKQGVKVSVVNECLYYGKKISSTRIRKELQNNNLHLVNKLLGYEYRK